MLGHAARRDELAVAGNHSDLITESNRGSEDQGEAFSQLALDPGRARVGKGKFGND